MKIRISEKDILKMDKAIKILVAKSQDYRHPDALLSRVMWNILFNPIEKKRCMKVLESVINNSELKDLPECQPNMPKI